MNDLAKNKKIKNQKNFHIFIENFTNPKPIVISFKSQNEINQIIDYLKNHDQVINCGPKGNIQEQFNFAKVYINFYYNSKKMMLQKANPSQFNLKKLFKLFPNWVLERYFLNHTENQIINSENKQIQIEPKEKITVNKNVIKMVQSEKKPLNYFYLGGDESGKGELLGNLTVAVCCCDQNSLDQLLESKLIIDSKKLSKKNIQKSFLKITTILKATSYVVWSLEMEKYNQYYNLFQNQNILLTYMYSIAWLKLRHQIISQNQKLIARFDQSEKIIDAFTSSKNFEKYINQIHESFKYDSIKSKYYDHISQFWFEPLKPVSYFKLVEKAETKYPIVATASILARMEFLKKWNAIWNPIENLLEKSITKGSAIQQKEVNQIIKIIQQQNPNLSLNDIIKKYLKIHFKIKQF
ncbi:Ribonuclease HIII [[Mycoplasma] cavipharyngis]|uniref:hypothetical protein n=1 Tax=[Mycoplasma] cavipharyngis TaxID=92757 RepID=UPI0037045BB4